MNKEISSLFLCRTPLQALICVRIIEVEKIEKYDIVYITQNNSEADLEYFARLEESASKALYLFIAQKKPDVLNHFSAIWRLVRSWKPASYDNVYLASIDSLAFRYLLKKYRRSTLSSFDDGTANITPSSNYYHQSKYRKAVLYDRLLGLPAVDHVKSSLSRHYSIYPGFDNIVDCEKVVYISLFKRNVSHLCDENVKNSTFFIGQPFSEYMRKKSIFALKDWLKTQSIDFYVMHPREKVPLIENANVLNKNGMLAEDAIFETAGDNRPRIISAYSSVLFNISHRDADKIYLSLGDDADECQRVALIRNTKSIVVDITGAYE